MSWVPQGLQGLDPGGNPSTAGVPHPGLSGGGGSSQPGWGTGTMKDSGIQTPKGEQGQGQGREEPEHVPCPHRWEGCVFLAPVWGEERWPRKRGFQPSLLSVLCRRPCPARHCLWV